MSTSSSVAQEFEQALAQHRQPNCPLCRKPLEVEQVQTQHLRWVWDPERKLYGEDDDDGNVDEPYCVNCGYSDWDFLSEFSRVSKLCTRLGLDYLGLDY